ncbi:MAG: AraC family transcriptional regulator [Myxococcales bacterium FL481]|nr:MAG: AraC family transcriptional regulator [Myxococcales bacterium FL481]
MLNNDALLSREDLRAFCRSVRSLGIDCAPALAYAGFDPERWDLVPEWVPPQLLGYLLDQVAERNRDPALGIRIAGLIAASRQHELAASSSAARGLPDLAWALFERVPVLRSVVELANRVEPWRSRLEFRSSSGSALSPDLAELAVASAVYLTREATECGAPWPILEIHFEHFPRCENEVYTACLLAPVRFGQPRTAVIYSRPDRHQFLPPGVSAGRATEYGRGPQPSPHGPTSRPPAWPAQGGNAAVSQHAREVLLEELRGGNPCLDTVAHRLGLHPRTLTRRLRHEGTTHQKLLDDLRYELAVEYLRRPEMPLREVARALGYSTVGAFGRAFRRWSGRSPMDVRAHPSEPHPTSVAAASPGPA